ncbi:MAG: polynucleotide adenylyltransferase PcnB [Conchiformibius sp.]|nr:polynucleotide adenylyltransferase PcnB [Conchiformibius sp.]
MLKKIIKRIRNRRGGAAVGRYYSMPLAVGNTAAVQILKRLQQEGFEAYLVGGAVRDLLLGITPKDFDIATNAMPEQVRRLFRRSRIIGRRFPIVHVMSGGETVEVSTFRSGQALRQNELGRIMRDTHYGTLEQDAVRRDFTCNALYYNVASQEVIDFHNGLDDIRARRLVIIGDAAARYQEDPVRILRAVRLSGKLGFEVEAQTAAPVREYAHLLKKEPVARLFDELMKLLFSGHASGCLKQLQVLGVSDGIHPLLSAMQADEDGMVQAALAQTDRRLREGQTVSAGFVLAAVLWPKVRHLWRQACADGQKPAAAMTAAIARWREDFEHGWGVPQRYSAVMREIWALQPHFAHRNGSRPFRLLAQPRFRAAYDFLLLRAQSGEAVAEEVQWWTDFQAADETRRQAMSAAQGRADGAAKPTKRKRRRRKKTAVSPRPD